MRWSKLILLTNPTKLFNEVDLFDTICDIGIPCLHIRRAEHTFEAYRNYLDRMPKKMRDVAILHEHVQLAEKYNLMGVHFKSTSEPQQVEGKIIGKSVHSFEEALRYQDLDYLYLSPIFDSVSKQGYEAPFDKQELKTFLNNWSGKAKLYALGGITPDNAKEALDMGFYGVVVLGSVWSQVMYTTIVRNWKKLKEVTGED